MNTTIKSHVFESVGYISSALRVKLDAARFTRCLNLSLQKELLFTVNDIMTMEIHMRVNPKIHIEFDKLIKV